MSRRRARRHDVSMHSPRVRSAVALATGAAILLALAACAPASTKHHPGGGSGHHGAGSTQSASPTPYVSTLDTTAPTPLANIGCSNLVTAADLSVAFPGVSVSLLPTASMAAGDLAGTDTQIPAADFVRDAGGIMCIWSNAPADHYITNFPTIKSEEISFLFNAAGTPWESSQKVDYSDPASDMNDGSCDTGSCELDQLVNGKTWVSSLELNQQPVLNDPFQNITTADTAAASSVTAQPLPTPAAGTLALGHTCTAFVADADASTALGTSVVSSQPLLQQDYMDFYGTWEGAQDELGDHPCVWTHGSTTVGHLSWLPAGAWAWDEAQALPLADGTPAPLSVPGLAKGDTAFIRCSASDASCVTDLIIGGNWIEAQVSQPGSINRAAVTAIADAIVTKLG